MKERKMKEGKKERKQKVMRGEKGKKVGMFVLARFAFRVSCCWVACLLYAVVRGRAAPLERVVRSAR